MTHEETDVNAVASETESIGHRLGKPAAIVIWHAEGEALPLEGGCSRSAGSRMKPLVPLTTLRGQPGLECTVHPCAACVARRD